MEEVEHFESHARAWPTLCQGDDTEALVGAWCANLPFDASRYASASTLMEREREGQYRRR